MHNLGTRSFRLAMAVMILGMSASSAHAYLDPGTGSMILQVLLGGIAGMAVAIKLYWHKFLAMSGMGRQAAGGRVQESSQLSANRNVEAHERGRP
jgi:hypothetical protein